MPRFNNLTFLCLSVLFLGILPSKSRAKQDITLSGNQVFTVNTGQTFVSAVTNDTSRLIVNGGSLNGQVLPRDFSTLDINGGSVNLITSAGHATINITGGNVSAFLTGDQNVVTMTGGTVDLLSVEAAQSTQIYGGTIGRLFSGSGSADVFGGNYQTLIASLATGNISIYGSDLVLSAPTPGSYTPGTSRFDGNYYTLTGRLSNNATSGTYTLFDALTRTVLSTGAVTSTPGSIILVSVPESGSFVFCLLGLSLLPIHRRIRSARR